MHGKGCGGFGGWNDKVWLIARRQAAGAPNRPPISEPPHMADWASFTPACVLDGSRCIARLWAGGTGEQCSMAPLRGRWVCRRHAPNSPHGYVNEEIPPEKMEEFMLAAMQASM